MASTLTKALLDNLRRDAERRKRSSSSLTYSVAFDQLADEQGYAN